MDKNTILFIGLAVLVVIGIGYQGSKDGAVGKEPPQFELKDLNGQTQSLEQHKGKVVLIDFWATWCPPCRAEIPNLKELYAARKDDGFVIIGLSLDRKEKELRDFVKKQAITWPQVYLGSNSGVAQDYGVRAIPSMFLVDRNGKLRYSKVRGHKVNEAVEELLQEQVSAQ